MLKNNISKYPKQLAERGERKHDGCKILMCSMSFTVDRGSDGYYPLWAYVSKKTHQHDTQQTST
jgi:hypothetical protein